jgi:hypothetical protein
MTVPGKENHDVRLPEGASLRQVAEVLADAWEAGAHQWTHSPLQLREEPEPALARPLPGDALGLFRLLHERQTPFLLVGGLAMLTYVKGRNTKDVDLLMPAAALEKIPELKIEDRNEFFAQGKFRGIQVDLLLTSNPLFKIVQERFATNHRFAEWEVPTATVEGLIVLKLYALPSLYRQFDMDRAALYETDITLLIARHAPEMDSLVELVQQHVEPGDQAELRKIVSECCDRAEKLRQRGAKPTRML